jgi:hypothetical protein
MCCCTIFLLPVAPLGIFAGPGGSAVTFFKIYLPVASFVCLAVAVLYFFASLVIELFGILDARSPRPGSRYVRN